MILTIPDDLMIKSNLTESQLMVQLALILFEKNILTFGQARKLSGLDVISFQKELGANNIPIHYDIDDFKKDLINLQSFKK